MIDTPTKATTAKDPAKPNRQVRRKQRTRASLIKAANEVFLSKGVEAASVAEITEKADVAHGTFYNYFNSVEDIVSASVEQILHEINEQIEIGGEAPESSDPATQIALGLRNLFKRVVSEPAFKWLCHKPDLVAEIIFHSIASDALQDIQLGIKTGDFIIPGDLAAAQNYTVWGFTGAMRTLSQSPGEIDRVTEEVTKVTLRILGVADTKSQIILEKIKGYST